MDKVQFNTEVVNMRKIVKRVKVLVVHTLTRQITRLRKKKGSEQQVLKNQRRADRFVAEVEAAKGLKPDQVTLKAVTYKKRLADVLNNPKSSAVDRVLARLIHHKLIQERVARFRGMVTWDLLRPGNKKYKRLRKSKCEAEAEAKLREEEEYQGTLEETIRTDCHGDGSESEEEEDGDTDSDRGDEEDSEAEQTDEDVDEDEEEASPEDEDEDSNGDEEDIAVEDGNRNGAPDKRRQPAKTSVSQREKTHSRRREPSGPPAMPPGRWPGDVKPQPRASGGAVTPAKTTDSGTPPLVGGVGKGKLESFFLGDLSSLVEEKPAKRRKELLKAQHKRRKLPEQQPKAREQSDRIAEEDVKTMTTSAGGKAVPRKVPMVDQPNALQPAQGEKLIPGINCHPELPLKGSRRDPREKTSRKPFSGRPQGRQLPGPRQPAGQSSHRTARHPTAGSGPSKAGPAPLAKPAAKESLHPSWEASKKRKAETKILPFQGKKITFDED